MSDVTQAPLLGPQVIHSAAHPRLIPAAWSFHVHGRGWSTRTEVQSSRLHHVHFAVEGSAAWHSGGSRVDLEPGGMYWAPSRGWLRRQCSQRFVSFWLVFAYEMIPGMDLLADWDQPARIGSWDVARYATQWQPALLTRDQAWLIAAMVETAVVQWCQPELATVISNQQRMAGRFAAVFAHLERNPRIDVRIEALAAVAGMQRSAFSRSFRASTGRSPKDYVSDVVNRRACELLLSTASRSKVIAHELGFGDEYHFNRFFSKHNGMPPGRYRQQFQSGAG